VRLAVTPLEKYDIFDLPVEIRVNILPLISPQLSNYMTENPRKDLVLNLSSVKFLDSSTIKLLVNLHKRMESDKKRLYLLKPSNDVMKIFSDVKLDGIFSFLNGCEELDKAVCSADYAAYLPFTQKENGLRNLRGSCPLCGSENIVGYLINVNDYDWKWESDYPFPTAYLKGTSTALDVIGLCPIVCAECFMCSTNTADFTVNDGNAASIRSSLGEDAKLLLLKDVKTRKKIVEDIELVVGQDFFSHPRKPVIAYNLHVLAESCVRSLTALKSAALPFWIGYYSYLSTKYAPSHKKDALIDNCRTWLTQVINEKQRYNFIHLSKTYFILLIAAISLNKDKEAGRLFVDFSELIDALPPGVKSYSSGFNSPAFWFTQAKFILEKQPLNAQ